MLHMLMLRERRSTHSITASNLARARAGKITIKNFAIFAAYTRIVAFMVWCALDLFMLLSRGELRNGDEELARCTYDVEINQ